MNIPSTNEAFENFIKQAWSGKELGPNQIAAIKSGFFAGVWHTVCAIQVVASPSVTEEEAVQYVKDLERDCEIYVQNLLARHSENN